MTNDIYENEEIESSTVYSDWNNGSGYYIECDANGIYYFCDAASRAPLQHALKNPDYVKWDENKGWIYKNGRELPWA